MTTILEPVAQSQVGRSVPASQNSFGVPPSGGPDPSSLMPEAAEFAKVSPNLFLKAAINIASVDFFTVLNRFDTAALSKRLAEKPELYFQLMNSFCNFMRTSLEKQKLEFRQKQADSRQRERAQKLRARKPILITQATCATLNPLFRSRRREEADVPTQSLEPSTAPASRIKNPAINSSRANTGESNIIELQPQEDESAIHEHHRWHECSQNYSDALIACPS